MRRTFCFFIIVLSIFLISCDSTVTLIETTPTVAVSITTVGTVVYSIEVTDSTVKDGTTAYINTNTILTEKTTFHTQTSTSTSGEFAFTPIGDNEWATSAKFTGLYQYPSTSYYSKEQAYRRRPNNSNGNEMEDVRKSSNNTLFFEMTIAGYTGEISESVDQILTEYYVYLKDLSSNEYLAETYKAKMEGQPGTPCYGCYFPQIGDTFIMSVRPSSFDSKIKEKGIYLLPAFKIVEIDGVKWVYPDIYTDFSSMKCAVKITDENERLFYKAGKDDEIIAYLEKSKIPNPTIDYKCELYSFIEEIRNVKAVDKKNFTPVGEYISILEAFTFEGFAEYTEDMQLDNEHPYLLKSRIDVTTYHSTAPNNKDTVVTIIGYKGDETYENGMYFSTYYVYAEPWSTIPLGKCFDDTVYEMRVYGTPSHPYYGQRRIEIGDRFLRLETDNSFVQTDDVLPATSLLYLSEGENIGRYYVFPDFNTDFSNVIVYTPDLDEVTESEKYVYIEGRDDDVIEYMKENGIEPPIYEQKAKYLAFSTTRRLEME